jgi:predicted DNA-binding WGR domain protein
MDTYDFRDQDPLWVRYADWISTAHDKFYEVRIDLDDSGEFIITRRWGRRPDIGVGQIKTEARHSIEVATRVALEYFNAKIAKGYREAERPYAANSQVAQGYGDDY